MTSGKLIRLIAQSVDGFIEGPEGEFDWPIMGPEQSANSITLTEQADALLYGRVVFEMMAGWWPRAEELSDDPHDLRFAPIWREIPKFVVSSTLEDADWNSQVINDNVAERIAALKASGTNLVMFGGAQLAGFLTEHGLIDEYQISIHPTVLGGGKPVFDHPERFDLRLVDARTVDEKVALLRYVRD